MAENAEVPQWNSSVADCYGKAEIDTICYGMARNGWVAYCGGGVQNRTDGSGDGYDLI